MDMITLAAARAYVQQTANALGAVKGAPCTIKNITESDDGATVVFSWIGADGKEQTTPVFIPRGPKGDPGEDVDEETLKRIEALSDEMDAYKRMRVTGDRMIAVTDKTDNSIRGLKLFGKTTQNGTPSAEAPIDLVSTGSNGSIKVDFVGKNLLGGEAFKNAFPQKAIYMQPDGSMQYFPSISYGGVLFDSFKPNTVYTFIFHAKGLRGKVLDLTLYYTDGTTREFRIPEQEVFATIAFHSDPQKSIQSLKTGWYNNGSGFFCDDCGIFEGALTVEDFEPYTVFGSLTASTTGGLLGVPTTIDGNYTDNNGQQWICDEIDFERGVYVKRCASIDSYSGQNVSSAYLSTTGALTTGAKVIYALDNVVENPLSADELAQFEALSTPYPSTTVVNNAGAGMEIDYAYEMKSTLENEVKGASDKIALVSKEIKGVPFTFNLPTLHLWGDISGMSKDVAVDLAYDYNNKSGIVSVKWQGSSSLSYPKKNFTIKFDHAFEAKEGWGEQKKYCFKANYIDHSHARNICSCKLWGEIVKSRANVPTELSSLPNGGAIDGFPCVIMLNGEFQGLYTWNIPKDGWMFGQPKAIVCADNHVGATMFKALATFNGDFELEYAEDENDTEWILPSLNTAIQAVINSDGTDIDSVVGQYIDIPSAIDYYIHTVDEGAVDGNSKNYLLVTFDGVKWYFSAYDRDTIYGIHWKGTSFYNPKETVTFTNFASHHRLMGLIRNHKTEELKSRAIELREGIASEANVATVFSNFISSIPSQLLDEDARRWPTIPSTSASNMSQIFNWYRLHRQVIDAEIDAMGGSDDKISLKDTETNAEYDLYIANGEIMIKEGE